MKIAITSDLHAGNTMIGTIIKMFKEMLAEKPDAIVIAGDVADSYHDFKQVLQILREKTDIPIGVVAGNHDLWNLHKKSSMELFVSQLPEYARQFNCTWLDEENIKLGKVAIAGSMAWYDYSSKDMYLGHDDSYYGNITNKRAITNDGRHLDLPYSDKEFARIIGEHLIERVSELQKDESVNNIVIVTHIPLHEGMLTRKWGNPGWNIATAYYGNLTLGKEILTFPKVSHMVAGHTHTAKTAIVGRDDMEDVYCAVVGSQYGSPTYLTLEV